MERSGSKSRAAEATPALQFWAPSSLGFLLVNYPGILHAWPCCSGELLQRQPSRPHSRRQNGGKGGRANSLSSRKFLGRSTHHFQLILIGQNFGTWLLPAAKCVGRYSFLLQVIMCLTIMDKGINEVTKQTVSNLHPRAQMLHQQEEVQSRYSDFKCQSDVDISLW